MLLVGWIGIGEGRCLFLNSWTTRYNLLPDGVRCLQRTTHTQDNHIELRVYKFFLVNGATFF